MAVRVQERAHAKINLNLTIHGRRSDGYHELSSLVAFAADVFDVVTLTVAEEFALDVGGAFGEQLDGHGNLIETAHRLAQKKLSNLRTGHFHLEKYIPIASGVGGGSADAAAALRALSIANDLDEDHEAFLDLAPQIGADVPVCLSGGGARAAFMQGIGEKVFRPCDRAYWPEGGLHAVLVNPGIEVSTAGVFKQLQAPAISDFEDIRPPEPFADSAAVLSYLMATTNDMQPAAVALAPEIDEVLQKIDRLPQCRLARMSGSGATCFGLFDSRDDASQAAEKLRAAREDWWIEPTRLT